MSVAVVGPPAVAVPTRQGVAEPGAVTAWLSRAEVLRGASVRVTGRADPSRTGDAVVLERREDGRWRTHGESLVGDDGRVEFRVDGWPDVGPYRYRVRLPATPEYRATRSPALTLVVQRRVTYRVETRGDLVVDRRDFQERVAEIYADPRGWEQAYVRFVRVRTGGAFSIVLAASEVMPTFGPICDTYWSCRVGRFAVINENRWRFGTPLFRRAGGTMAEYRAMVTNHETGHWFGLGHAGCPADGAPAPVMMQQSMGLHGCEPNPWPLPREAARIR